MDYRSMEGLKRALNRPKSALADSVAYSLVTNLNDDYLLKILTFVNDKNREWWNWSERTLEQEVELLFNGIKNNKKDKGIQTTISSIGYALMCNNGTITEHEALIRIHDEWEAITSHYDSDERLAKEDRVSQYKNFEGLTDEEQNKDKVWITAVKEIVKKGGGLRRKATKRKATRRKATRRMTKKRRVSKHKVTKRNSKRKNTRRRRR